MELEDFIARCYRNLANPRYRGVLHYLIEERGLSASTIRGEMIGFCDWETDRIFNRDYYDGKVDSLLSYVCKRLIVPIRDDIGDIVGFASRSPDPNVHSGWINSRFPKDNFLYGLDKAKAAAFSANKIYLVEGYADRLVLAQFGLENVVAIMGAGLNSKGLGLILRYCNRICVCFDMDPRKNGKEGAGQRALAKLKKQLREGLSSFFEGVSSIELPIGIDPDEFVLEHESVDPLLALEKPLKCR